MRNNSTRLQGKKKTSTSQYQSFEHNGREICDQKRLESFEEKKGGSHFMQALSRCFVLHFTRDIF